MSGLVSIEQIAARLSAWPDHDVRTKRAGLVQRAEDSRWRSCNRWLSQPERDPRRLFPWPMARPPGWAERVNKSLTGAKLPAVRTRVTRDTPLGNETWVQRITLQLNRQSTLRPRGRPQKES